MKKRSKRIFGASVAALAAFALWTALVCTFDLGAIGPRGSAVGFSAVNGFFSELVGSNMFLYDITDWLGLIPLAIALGFSVLGLQSSLFSH